MCIYITKCIHILTSPAHMHTIIHTYEFASIPCHVVTIFSHASSLSTVCRQCCNGWRPSCLH